MDTMQGVCGCHHHKVVPGMILLIGVTFLLGNLNVISAGAVNMIWPILLIIAGGTKMMAHKCTCCSRP